MAQKDYYNILGVSRNATQEEIRKAYLSLTRKYHPDINHGPDAKEKFQEAKEAFEILSDPKTRERYDNFGTTEDLSGQGFGGFSEEGFSGFYSSDSDAGFSFFSDILEQVFGKKRERNAAKKGGNITEHISLSLEEAFFGKNVELEVKKNISCDSCSGKGYMGPIRSCEVCNGKGYEETSPQNRILLHSPCRACKGSTISSKNICMTCRGTGVLAQKTKVRIEIPGGIDNDQVVRKIGFGHVGERGGASGDFLLVISVKPHPIFTREKNDLKCNIFISVEEAILGATREITTIDGIKRELKIPEGTQPGTIISINDSGMSSHKSNTRGKLYITILVEIPKNLNSEQKKIISQLNLNNRNYTNIRK